jgi:hypothetical protein
MTDDSDIRELLGRAVGDEPPMRIDRGEVFRQGRKRLRRRRMLEAGGVVAGVVAIAVGAITLTGPRGDRHDVPAADQPEPPPSLLVTPEPTAVSSFGDTPLATTEQHALDMTVALTEFLPEEMALEPMPGSDDSGFLAIDGVYQLAADVVGSDAEGSLHIAVAPAKTDDQTDCVMFVEDYQECQLLGTDTGPVAVATEKFANGEQRYVAFVSRADGTTVNAVITNLSERQRESGEWPSMEPPLLSQQAFAQLATLSGLTYYY